MSGAYAIVDWGTTRVRIWLADRDGTILGERRSDEGMVASAGRFEAVLEAHLTALGASPRLPAFICGMAGARQGWVEAPYVPAPASLEQIFGSAVRVEGAARPVLILPGLSQDNEHGFDVLRGEETQLAGLRERSGEGAHVVCLPGTHSKWAVLDGARVERFSTFLTGELFAVLGQHSILRHSLGGEAPHVDPGSAAFRDACAEAWQTGDLGGSLFSVRAKGLLRGTSPADAAARLSGLLLGAELFSARRRFGMPDAPVILLASGALHDLYAAAFDIAGMPFRPADADEAVRNGLKDAAHLYRELWA